MKTCGYPGWTITRVKENMKKVEKRKGNSKKEDSEKNKGMVVLPYVGGVSEKLARIFKKRNISSAMKPHTTLKTLLVHPKEGVYTIDCFGCDN